MDFAVLPPEINSERMYSGPGSGPMLAAATAWDGLADELHSAAAAYKAEIAGLTDGPWLGPASAAMAAAAATHTEWLTGADLQAVLRQHGHQSPDSVHLAIFEAKGAISVLRTNGQSGSA